MSNQFLDRIQELDDLQLAVLVSLIAEEQLVCTTEAHSLRALQGELQAICFQTFGLHSALIECTPKTTIDEFSDAVLIEVERFDDDDNDNIDHRTSNFSPSRQLPTFRPTNGSLSRNSSLTPAAAFDERRVADVIIATNLHLADSTVQTQALELIRTRRIFTRAAMHSASRSLLFIAVLPNPPRRYLSHHLNDLFAISHHHPSTLPPRHDLPSTHQPTAHPAIPSATLAALRAAVARVPVTAELAQYLHNLSVFLRAHRFVAAGATATATRHLRTIARTLAPLHGLDYVTPSLVALAARKVYAHRIRVVDAGRERSLMWGSELEAVREALEGVTPEGIVEDVLEGVEMPL